MSVVFDDGQCQTQEIARTLGQQCLAAAQERAPVAVVAGVKAAEAKRLCRAHRSVGRCRPVLFTDSHREAYSIAAHTQ